MDRATLPRLTVVLLSVVVGAALLAACGDDETSSSSPAPPTPTQVQAPTPTTVPPTPEPTDVPAIVTGSGIEGGDPLFDYGTMIWQGYWLSRDQFGPFVMASGMGIPFEPPMDSMQMAMQMVAQNPDDPVMIPQNMMPLQAVYAAGSPALVNDPRNFDPMDFEGLRIDSSISDQTITVGGQAQTMLKESQWAHNFGSGHFGAVTGDFGAQQRFMGMMVSMLAQMQGQYAMQNLMGEDGLYRDSDGTLDYTGNWAMLHVLSDIAGLVGDMDGRYMSPDMHPVFDGAATGLFEALKSREPESAREAATAIRALVYRASTSDDAEVRAAALDNAKAIGDGLVASQTEDVVEQAAAIVGLIAIGVADGDENHLAAADSLFAKMTEDFDSRYGIFKSKTVYSVDDVAWIIGALNSVAQKGTDEAKPPARDTLLAFYESTISLAGMQVSAPPGKDGAMAGEWEKNLPTEIFYHPANTPPPPMAGTLPVPAEEITWDGQAWSVTSDRFVTAGAMHLANELNWLGPHLGSIPFPEIAR